MLKKLLLILILVPVVVMTGCQGERGPIGPAGEPAVANSTCLSSECHGDSTANKIIVNDLGTEEIVPLYVNESKYASTIHGTLLCVSCHTDINASGGSHANVRKVYGGWARFGRKQAVEALDINDVVRTRNYTTAASYGCISCHKEKANFMNSAHATIFKHRSALIDADLSALCGKTVGEDYASGDCNRCHATCATCHFKSTITQINPNGSALTYWDQLQSSYPNVPGWDDKMTEFSMDWTTNVVSHEFRGADYFAADSESVCEACHTGYAKPASMAYWWLDEANGVWDSIKATAVKRHPQAYELAISGDLGKLLNKALSQARQSGNQLEIALCLKRKVQLAASQESARRAYLEAVELFHLQDRKDVVLELADIWRRRFGASPPALPKGHNTKIQ